MNRRDALKGIIALPFIAFLLGRKPSPSLVVDVYESDYMPPEKPEDFADVIYQITPEDSPLYSLAETRRFNEHSWLVRNLELRKEPA